MLTGKGSEEPELGRNEQPCVTWKKKALLCCSCRVCFSRSTSLSSFRYSFQAFSISCWPRKCFWLLDGPCPVGGLRSACHPIIAALARKDGRDPAGLGQGWREWGRAGRGLASHSCSHPGLSPLPRLGGSSPSPGRRGLHHVTLTNERGTF